MDNKNTQFKVLENGPLEVNGDFKMYNASNELITKQGPVYLCRCGGSSDKPFCDGTHEKIGFSG